MLVEDFFTYARERYDILLRRRAGWPRPWTNDPILQQYRFCNVFREDDVVTRWIDQNVRKRYAHSDYLLQAVVVARWFNRPDTIERLLEDDLLVNWDPAKVVARLQDKSPLVTGAYMIKTPPAMNKLDGIVLCSSKVAQDAYHLQARIEPGDTTLEGVHDVLCEYSYLGPFMAYEIVTDLRHTHLLDQAPDINTWASMGPGAARGLQRITGKRYNYNRRQDQRRMLTDAQQLLACSRYVKHWPPTWPRWEMREVEHTLCEFDKYERARLGEGRPKQKYTPA